MVEVYARHVLGAGCYVAWDQVSHLGEAFYDHHESIESFWQREASDEVH